MSTPTGLTDRIVTDTAQRTIHAMIRAPTRYILHAFITVA